MAVFVAFGVCSFAPVFAQAADGLQPISSAPEVLSVEPSPLAIASAPAPAAKTAEPAANSTGALAAEASPPSPSASATDPVSVPAKVETISSAPSAAPRPEDTKKQEETFRKKITGMEEKAISNAKSAIKRLDTGSDSTTLEDLNSARQTITRIEAVIDLEKHLKELEKLRSGGNEYNMASSQGALAGAIPQSALMPEIPASLLAEPPVSHAHAKHLATPARPEILQIYGTGGKYTAVLKLFGSEERQVKVGDKISDDETVRAITPSSVEVKDKTASYTLYIKKSGIIQSAMR
jgi:type IV pilus biogenesis protein PilP